MHGLNLDFFLISVSQGTNDGGILVTSPSITSRGIRLPLSNTPAEVDMDESRQRMYTGLEGQFFLGNSLIGSLPFGPDRRNEGPWR